MKKKLAAILMSGIMLLGASNVALAAEYPDVSEGDWFYEYVMDVSSKEYMSGYENGNFGPVDNLTRGQFATILWRIGGSRENVGEDEKFPDVPEDVFYAQASKWASYLKIMTGYEDGRFGGEDNITREQAATVLLRFATLSFKAMGGTGDINTFPDVENVSEFAKHGMTAAVGVGIISGDNGYLNPQGEVNRAVASTMISRFDNEVLKTSIVPQPEQPQPEQPQPEEPNNPQPESPQPEKKYDNIVVEGINGTVVILNESEEIKPGEKVFLEYKPDEGYKLEYIEVCRNINGVAGPEMYMDGGLQSFTMPDDGISDGVTIRVRYMKISDATN